MSVSEKRGHEEIKYFASFGKIIDDPVLILDDEMQPIYANEQTKKLLGYNEDEIYNMNFKNICVLGKNKDVKEALKKIIQKRYDSTISCHNSRGKSEEFRLKAYPLPIGDKKYILLKMTKINDNDRRLKVLQMASELLGEAIVITDHKARIFWMNSAAERLFGYKLSEVEGKMLYDYMVADREKFKKRVSEYASIEQDEFRIRKTVDKMVKKDGSVFLAEITHTMAKIYNRRYAIAIIKDITERKRMEDILKKEKEKLEFILNEMLNMVVIIQDEKIVFVNNSFSDITGFRKEDVIGAHFTLFIHESAKHLVIENYRRRMMGLPVIEEYIIPAVGKDNQLRWFYIRAKIIEYEGKKADMVSMVDVTPLKVKERRILSINEMVKRLMISNAKNEMYDTVLNTLKQEFAFDSAYIVEIVGDKVHLKKHFGWALHEDPHKPKEKFEWILRYNQPYRMNSLRFIGKEKVAGRFEEYITPVIFSGKLYGAIGVVKKGEIEDEERYLVDLIASNLGARINTYEQEINIERSREMMELLLHIVSHDIKTPLAVIDGYAELLLEEYSKDYAKEIKNATSIILDLINKAKTISRMEMLKEEYSKEEISIKEIVESASEIVLKKYPKGLVAIEGDKGAIRGYPLLLQEMLVNLVENSFSHGGKTVKVIIKEEGKKVTVKIVDDGPGIPGHLRDSIFKPFVKYKGGGSGLGLAIVKKAVNMHNGTIKVENNKPRGSIFVIELPKE